MRLPRRGPMGEFMSLYNARTVVTAFLFPRGASLRSTRAQIVAPGSGEPIHQFLLRGIRA